MGINELRWSKTEKDIAHRIFDEAYKSELRDIKTKITDMLADSKDDSVVWKIHDLLTWRRKNVDRKYDYRYSRLIVVFAELLNEGFLSPEDLEGLSKEKKKK